MIPAIGFVNENRLYQDGSLDGQRVRLLEQWLDAGLDLGNHTYSHKDLHKVPLDEFKADILKGHEVTLGLLEARGKTVRYFRHPYFHAGRDLETRKDLNHFLAENGYEVAPATIDNADYIFANAYEIAHSKEDEELKARIGETFVSYIRDKFIFFERNCEELFGRQIRQILILHGSRLNADYLASLVEMIRSLGYDFVSLETALEDEAYQSKDTFVGKAGITWIHRWAITKGMSAEFYEGEPTTPKFVSEVARSFAPNGDPDGPESP
ncbi:MAG: polysaccharide deacetylase family protein [Myxococcota bacterium]|nr:polysaccharide deacetylase family protein [Myxococcota bacterium]